MRRLRFDSFTKEKDFSKLLFGFKVNVGGAYMFDVIYNASSMYEDFKSFPFPTFTYNEVLELDCIFWIHQEGTSTPLKFKTAKGFFNRLNKYYNSKSK